MKNKAKNFTASKDVLAMLRLLAIDQNVTRDQMILKILNVYLDAPPSSVRGVDEAIRVKVTTDVDVWERAVEKAHDEGRSIQDVVTAVVYEYHASGRVHLGAFGVE